MSKKEKGRVDWAIVLIPVSIIIITAFFIMFAPEKTNTIVQNLRNYCVNELGFFYILLGIFVFGVAIWIASSKFGKIKLGEDSNPQYSTLAWGSMIFTATMSADIIYWSLVEWAYYFGAQPFGLTNMGIAQRQDLASAYTLFHWGPIPWSLYILPATAYAYMIYVKKTKHQVLSEACRSILGKHADKLTGRSIDIFAIVGLLAGAATTFSLVIPLIAGIISKLFGIKESPILSIIILIVIGVIFLAAVLRGLKGIAALAKIATILFITLIVVVVIFGPKMYMIETAITSIGTLIDKFIPMSTWMDPLRVSAQSGSGFPQEWTVFYWAYWTSWIVSTPFFIAKISKGRTIRQVIFGGLGCGIIGTYLSFLTLGSFSLSQQTKGCLDIVGKLGEGANPVELMIETIQQLPFSNVILLILVFCLIALYATTFDALTLVVAEYSEKNGDAEHKTKKKLQVFWTIIFMILPIVLIFSESTLEVLKTFAIVAGLPLGIIIIVVIASFLKDLIQREKRGKKENG